MRTYVQPGEVLTLTVPYDVAPGAGVLVGTLFGVAKNPALNGTPTECQMIGVCSLAKATGLAWTQGAKLYWDNTAKNVTTTAGGNTAIGAAATAQAAGDTAGNVYLDGSVR